MSVLRGGLPLHSTSPELRRLLDDAPGDPDAFFQELVALLRFIVHRFYCPQRRVELVELLY